MPQGFGIAGILSVLVRNGSWDPQETEGTEVSKDPYRHFHPQGLGRPRGVWAFCGVGRCGQDSGRRGVWPGACPNPPEVAASVLGWAKAVPRGRRHVAPVRPVRPHRHHCPPCVPPPCREGGRSCRPLGPREPLIAEDKVAPTPLRQRFSSSLLTAPVGDSHLLVWHPDPVLHPMHCAYGCLMSQRQRPAGGRASGETQVEG